MSRLQKCLVHFSKAFLAHRLADEEGLEMQSAYLWALADFSSTLDCAGVWLLPEESSRAASSGRLHLKCFMMLAEGASLQSVPRYKVRPKSTP